MAFGTNAPRGQQHLRTRTRLAIAFVAAPISAAALASAFVTGAFLLVSDAAGAVKSGGNLFAVLSGFGLLASGLIGAPAYAILSRRARLTESRAVSAGAAVAMVGGLVLGVALWVIEGEGSVNLIALGLFALFGAFGGWVFGRVAGPALSAGRLTQRGSPPSRG